MKRMEKILPFVPSMNSMAFESGIDFWDKGRTFDPGRRFCNQTAIAGSLESAGISISTVKVRLDIKQAPKNRIQEGRQVQLIVSERQDHSTVARRKCFPRRLTVRSMSVSRTNLNGRAGSNVSLVVPAIRRSCTSDRGA